MLCLALIQLSTLER